MFAQIHTLNLVLLQQNRFVGYQIMLLVLIQTQCRIERSHLVFDNKLGWFAAKQGRLILNTHPYLIKLQPGQIKINKEATYQTHFAFNGKEASTMFLQIYTLNLVLLQYHPFVGYQSMLLDLIQIQCGIRRSLFILSCGQKFLNAFHEMAIN